MTVLALSFSPSPLASLENRDPNLPPPQKKAKKNFTVGFRETVARRITKLGKTSVCDELFTARDSTEKLKRGSDFAETFPAIDYFSQDLTTIKLPKSAQHPLPPKKNISLRSAEWPCDLELFKEQALHILALEKSPVTHETLFSCMCKLSQDKKEYFTLQELQELYAAISLEALRQKFKIKNLIGTRDEYQDIILDVVKKSIKPTALFAQLKVLLKTDMTPPIKEITPIGEDRILIRYDRVSLVAIHFLLLATSGASYSERKE